MPSPGVPAPPRSSLEDSYLELLTDTLETLDLPARGQFLQRYLRAVTHLDLRESQCLQLWEEIITRRRQLSDALHRTVSLKTALMDVFSTAGLLRVPVLIEYDELKKLNLNAVTDSLTELYNRRVFNEFFERELNRAKRYNQPLGLVMMDMHRFKEVNDKHGHPRGDEVLRMAAATLKKALRTSDFAFRIGGDEFALILPQTDAPQAHALSRRVETVFADTLKSLQLNVTVGMDYGVANFPQDADNTDELVRIADEGAYAVVLLDDITYSVATDGQAVEHRRHVVKILRPQGRDNAVIHIGFDKDTKILSMNVWSIGADGHEYAMKDKDFSDVGLDGDSDMFQDDRFRVARAPGADPGSVVAYEYEQRARPFVTEKTWSFQNEIPRLNQSFTLELPPGYSYRTVWAHHATVPAAGAIRTV